MPSLLPPSWYPPAQNQTPVQPLYSLVITVHVQYGVYDIMKMANKNVLWSIIIMPAYKNMYRKQKDKALAKVCKLDNCEKGDGGQRMRCMREARRVFLGKMRNTPQHIAELSFCVAMWVLVCKALSII